MCLLQLLFSIFRFVSYPVEATKSLLACFVLFFGLSKRFNGLHANSQSYLCWWSQWSSNMLAKGWAAVTEIHVNASRATSGHWPTVTLPLINASHVHLPFMPSGGWNGKHLLKWHISVSPLLSRPSIWRSWQLCKREREPVRFTGSQRIFQFCCQRQ